MREKFFEIVYPVEEIHVYRQCFKDRPCEDRNPLSMTTCRISYQLNQGKGWMVIPDVGGQADQVPVSEEQRALMENLIMFRAASIATPTISLFPIQTAGPSDCGAHPLSPKSIPEERLGRA